MVTAGSRHIAKSHVIESPFDRHAMFVTEKSHARKHTLPNSIYAESHFDRRVQINFFKKIYTTEDCPLTTFFRSMMKMRIMTSIYDKSVFQRCIMLRSFVVNRILVTILLFQAAIKVKRFPRMKRITYLRKRI